MDKMRLSIAEQLPLALSLRDEATFSSFCTLPHNVELLQQYQDYLSLNKAGCFYIWGKPQSGLSHLLFAACHAQHQANGGVIYLNLKEQLAHSPAILEGLETFTLVCLDDIEAIAGRQEWEVALFHLYNRLCECQHQLVVASHMSPSALPIQLPDLVSRLSWGLVYQLHALDDEEKLVALQWRAKARGFALSDAVGHFLLRRHPRDMHALFALLERLDQASLAAQRKLTIPFVKSVMDGSKFND